MAAITEIITQAARSAGLSPDVMLRIAEIESSLNPAARSSTGKYLGLFQLSQDEFTANGGGDIFDAADNARAAARKLKAESDRYKSKHGRAPGAYEIYMIHQQGWSGFHALEASPDSLAWVAIRSYYATDAVAKAAIAGNCPASWGPGVALTARQFLEFWRARIDPPVWLALARREIGQREGAGAADNPDVVAYYADAGHAEVKHDDVAWCAAFVGAMLHRAGLEPSGSLMARSYLKWGSDIGAPRAGCIAVLWRNSPDAAEGHVGFVVAWSATIVTLLGGNQSDGVNETSFPRDRVLGWRWPVGLPAVITSPAVAPTRSEDELTEKLREYVEAFASITPTLARAMGSPARGLVAAAIVDVIKRSGKQMEGEDAADTLNRVGVAEGVSLLRLAEGAVAAVGAVLAPEPASAPVVITPAPAPVTPAPTSPPAVEPTPFDALFGQALSGWKTYIVIILATLLNVAAGLGWLPMVLTPDVVAACNTALAGLGGAALVSKIERYAKLGAGLIKKP